MQRTESKTRSERKKEGSLGDDRLTIVAIACRGASMDAATEKVSEAGLNAAALVARSEIRI